MPRRATLLIAGLRLPLPLLLLLLLLLATCSCSKSPPPWAALPQARVQGDSTVGGAPAVARRLTSAPTIDGRLDDAAWSGATALGPFVDPGFGEADRSVLAGSFAKVGWDQRALYFGFWVPDRDPFSPAGRNETDPHLWERSSAVEVMLQPGDPGDNREYYELQLDLNGAVFDTRWDDYNHPITEGPAGRVFGHQDWSSHAERAGSAERAGYSVEVALPWASFSSSRSAVPPRPGDVWRLNLYAFRDGQRVSNAWSPLKREGNFHKSSRFGRVRFE